MSAGQTSSPESHAALSKLCETYWLPLYVYVQRRVSSTAEAQDLTQAFFVAFLEKNYAETADPQRGRFRAFLLTAFKHFLSKEWAKEKALKRGGGQRILSLDFRAADSSLQIEPSTNLTPEQQYDRQWAITLLAHVLDQLAGEYQARNQSDLFERLKLFITGDNPGTSYADVASQLQMNEPAVRKTVSRMRQRYRELLRIDIGHTVSDSAEVEDEIRNLFATLQL